MSDEDPPRSTQEKFNENEINDHALNVYDLNDYVFYEKQWTSFYLKSTFPLPYPFLAEIYHIETSTHQAFLIEL